VTLAPDYCTVAELKAHLTVADTVDDTALAVVVTAASRAVDEYCNRQFGNTGTATAAVYTYPGQWIEARPALLINDVQDTTGLILKFDQNYDGIFEVTVTLGTDFDMWPYNAPLVGEPYTALTLRPQTSAYFPLTARGVQLTAIYGWTAVPSAVKQATLIQAARYFMRRYSWAGVAGSPELGNELRLLYGLDNDVKGMLGPYKRWWGAS
jgi:hypothetical protein